MFNIIYWENYYTSLFPTSSVSEQGLELKKTPHVNPMVLALSLLLAAYLQLEKPRLSLSCKYKIMPLQHCQESSTDDKL